jgi:predicted urease superfamily metal-dependent hydrolase
MKRAKKIASSLPTSGANKFAEMMNKSPREIMDTDFKDDIDISNEAIHKIYGKDEWEKKRERILNTKLP